jgi:hypothetical protein
MRFDPDCTTRDGVARYLHHRALQLLADGFTCPVAAVTPLLHDGVEWGAAGVVERDGAAYHSVYVYAQHRGSGHMRRFFAEFTGRIVTTPGCEIEAALTALGADFVVAGQHTTTPEYAAISAHYGDRRARRSGASRCCAGWARASGRSGRSASTPSSSPTKTSPPPISLP